MTGRHLPGGVLRGFLGAYLHQIDEKGRVALPAPFRRDQAGASFVLLHWYDHALFLYPSQSWTEVEERLRELRRRRPDSRLEVARLTANAVEVVPDKQGRILIPERLKQAIKLDTEVLIVGALDRIELWNPKTFEEITSGIRPEMGEFVRQILA
ncbi:MAG: division/cell wall cluster transcriptional repressor MraZ [Gemmatimonadetes bacterium]|nr:division/cell wall cluster transcriptional repressor MraZ [Gemmatimonadota bacterium]